MAAPLTWALSQAADALGLTVPGFCRRRARLEAAGFPRPLPGLRRRYDPLAIQGWLARLRGDDPATPEAAPPFDSDAALKAELDRRALTLATARGHA